MKNALFKKGLLIGIIVMFIGFSVIPSTGNIIRKNKLTVETIINGPTYGEIGELLEYSLILISDIEDDIWFDVYWGDGTYTDYIGPCKPNEEMNVSNIWYESGVYEIIAQAENQHYCYPPVYLNVTIADENILIDENFSGTFPPNGWETNYWTQCNESCGNEPPCACLYSDDLNESDDAYIYSKPVDASSFDKVELEFIFGIIVNTPFSLYVSYRVNETSPWKDITPWDNPIYEDIYCDYFNIGIYSFSHPNGCGEALQINWWFTYYYNFEKSLLDDVLISVPYEYYPPGPPIIDGPTHGTMGIEYTYTFDTIYYNEGSFIYDVRWGDGSSEIVNPTWPDPEEPGPGIANHSWEKNGTYVIKARIIDSFNYYTPWSKLTVTMPRTKSVSNSLLLRFLERYPLLNLLLQRLNIL